MMRARTLPTYEEEDRCPLSPGLDSTVLESAVRADQQDIETQGIPMRKEGEKHSLCADNKMLCIENPERCTHILIRASQ